MKRSETMVDRSSYIAILDRLIPLADKHQAEDEHQAWRYEPRNGKACGIGWTNHDANALGIWQCDPGDHKAMAEALGTGVWLPRMIDHLFENLPLKDRPSLVPRVLRGIRAVHVRGGNFERIAQAHTSRCLERCLNYIEAGDEPWRVEVRAVITIARDATAAGRWTTKAERERAFEAWLAWGPWGACGGAERAWVAWALGAWGGAWVAWGGAEIAAQRDDLLEGLEGAKAVRG